MVLYDEDLTLYPDNEYLVSDNFVMIADTTLNNYAGSCISILVTSNKIFIEGDVNAHMELLITE